jgi:hypothetical protein
MIEETIKDFILNPCALSRKCATIKMETVKKTNCDSGLCAVEKLGIDDTAYKIRGPNDVALLNNMNIDLAMSQFAEVYTDFYPYKFNMRNYATYSFDNGRVSSSPDTLATVSIEDLYAKGFRRCGCVINTDVYQGPGQHWMALFADFRSAPATVEFFNSSGRAPTHEYTDWMIRAVNSLKALGIAAKRVTVSKFEHQRSMTECGVYSLYYIWSRLRGITVQHFSTQLVPDSRMFEFRTQIYHDPTFIGKYLDAIFSNKKFITLLKASPEDGKISKYMKKHGVGYENGPLRYLIMDSIKDLPEFDEYTRFNYGIYEKIVDIKWEE